MPQKKNYEILRNKPVAEFDYEASHSHPVKRTIVIIKDGLKNPKIMTGYEIREGLTTRSLKNAPIKSFRKDKIATIGQLDLRRNTRKNAKANELDKTTLRRSNLLHLILNPY